ncbi:MAG: biotin synthase BioB [Gemmatimonadales bacterium]
MSTETPSPRPPLVAAADSAAWLEGLLAAGLERRRPAAADGLALLRSVDDLLLDVVAAAARVRRCFFGTRIKLSFLVNVKSGGCPEDCAYCSQSRGSEAEILRYPWIDSEAAAELAERAAARGALRVCLVAAGRAPSGRDLSRVEGTVAAIRKRCPGLEVCVSLGLLREEEAERLRGAGVSAYNHNLNTSERRYGEICTTHSYADRRATAARAGQAGLSLCSGAIFGMGERDEEVVELALALRELEPTSVPVNFRIPLAGTPLAAETGLTPQRCLRILALMRFVFPDTELRLAAGRELHLRTAQPLALQIADSIFIGDYLTSEGQATEADLAMIRDAGLVVDGAVRRPEPESGERVASRRRGPGTDVSANV